MNQGLATDVPAWLKNVLVKIHWNDLNFVLRKAIKEIVHAHCNELPQKTGDTFYTKILVTSAPSEVVSDINYVDFNSMSPAVQQNFRRTIEDAVKTYLGVQL